MSSTNQQTDAQKTQEELRQDKGKGKAVEEVEDDSSDEEMGEEPENIEEDVEEDDLAEIDTTNIIEGGRRTRGKKIDFAKAAAEADAMEEDSEDDEDFKAPPEDSEMQQ